MSGAVITTYTDEVGVLGRRKTELQRHGVIVPAEPQNIVIQVLEAPSRHFANPGDQDLVDRMRLRDDLADDLHDFGRVDLREHVHAGDRVRLVRVVPKEIERGRQRVAAALGERRTCEVLRR